MEGEEGQRPFLGEAVDAEAGGEEDPAGAGGAGPAAPGGGGPAVCCPPLHWIKQNPCTGGGSPSNSFGLSKGHQMWAGVTIGGRVDTRASFAPGASLCPLGISCFL